MPFDVQIDRDELRVLIKGVAQSAPWRGEGDVRVRLAADGRVVGMRFVGFGKWAASRAVLVDVVARTMAIDRDEVDRAFALRLA